MKPAYRSDEAFLAEVRATLERGGAGCWWLGQSGFLLVQRGRALVFDPYLSDSLTRKYASTDKPHVRISQRVIAPETLASLGVIDAITSSHAHTDHLDAETLQPLLRAGSQPRLIFPAANREIVRERVGPEAESQLVEVEAGHSCEVAGIEFHGIPAAHNTVERDAAGRHRFLGFVVRWGELGVYHSGDTLWHDTLVSSVRARGPIDLALLPINGNQPERRVPGNLDGAEAARLAHVLEAKCVVPCHYDLFAFNTASPETFENVCQAVGQSFRTLRLGEGLIWS